MTRLVAACWIVAAVSTALGQSNAPMPLPTLPPPVPSSAPTPTPLPMPAMVPSSSVPAPSVPTLGDIVIHPMPVPALRTPASFAHQYGAVPAYTGRIPDCTSGACGAGGCSTGGCNSCLICDPCVPCGPKGRFWGEFDAILWKARGDNLPPLVSTSPTGTPAAQSGVLGTPGARVLLGGQQSEEWRPGFRANIGAWLNCSQTVGIQAGGFWLDDGGSNSVFASSGDPALSRPFTNALTGTPNSQLVALPGILAGSVGVDSSSRIGGFDAALRGNMCCGCCWRLDALIGYRYLRLEDDLAIREDLVAGPNAPGQLGVPTGTGIVVNDRFDTSNTFHGIQAGIAGEYRLRYRWVVEGTAKASFGALDQVANIYGDTTVSVPGQAATRNLGGLYALSSNIGSYSYSDWILVPEVNLNLAYQITDNLRLRVGYSFLYLSSVTRPGGIIDTVVNPSLIPPVTGNPTPARPTVLPDRSDYYLHGINLGAEVRF